MKLSQGGANFSQGGAHPPPLNPAMMYITDRCQKTCAVFQEKVCSFIALRSEANLPKSIINNMQIFLTTVGGPVYSKHIERRTCFAFLDLNWLSSGISLAELTSTCLRSRGLSERCCRYMPNFERGKRVAGMGVAMV